MQIKLCEIADKLEAEIVNPPKNDVEIHGLASLLDAGANELSFYHHRRYLNDLRVSQAAAVLVDLDFNEGVNHLPLLKVKSPSLAFDEMAKEFYSNRSISYERGIHSQAVIAADVELDSDTVSVGAHAVIGSGTSIGGGTIIGSGVSIGSNVEIGGNCHVYSNSVLYDRTCIGSRVILHAGCVVGADGFGFEFDGGSHKKIEQFGHVQIDDDVEIGANSTIDRGRFGKTWIGAGTKIDNLVQIGHNVRIGRSCIIVADTAIGGSSKIGDNVTMAAQVGVAGHLEIGAHSILVARTGVTKNLPGGKPEKPAFYSGFPAGPIERIRKEMVYPRKIPAIMERLKAIEAQLAGSEK